MQGDKNHEDSEVYSLPVTIKPMTISKVPVYDLHAMSKVYDGTTAMDDTFKIDGFYKTTDDKSDANKQTLKQGTDFTVKAKYAQADVGASIDVEMTFTLLSENYVFDGNTKTVDYTCMGGIEAADAPAQNNPELPIANKHAKTYTVDLTPLLPKLSGTCSYGTVTYGQPMVSLGSYYNLRRRNRGWQAEPAHRKCE